MLSPHCFDAPSLISSSLFALSWSGARGAVSRGGCAARGQSPPQGTCTLNSEDRWIKGEIIIPAHKHKPEAHRAYITARSHKERTRAEPGAEPQSLRAVLQGEHPSHPEQLALTPGHAGGCSVAEGKWLFVHLFRPGSNSQVPPPVSGPSPNVLGSLVSMHLRRITADPLTPSPCYARCLPRQLCDSLPQNHTRIRVNPLPRFLPSP